MIRHETIEPDPRLASMIAHYGIVDVPAGINNPFFSPPVGLNGFIIRTYDGPVYSTAKIDGRDFFTEEAVVTGQTTLPVYGDMIGPARSVLVFFQPLGTHLLFGTDMQCLTNSAQPLVEFLGRQKAEKLIQQLKSDQTDEQQISVLNQFFLTELDNRATGELSDNLEPLLAMIHTVNGDIDVKKLELESGLSIRTLERHFQKKIGLAPKKYIKIVQFKQLIRLLAANPEMTWTELSIQAGYYDQAHMSRYVREYLEVSPNNIVKLDTRLINYLLQ